MPEIPGRDEQILMAIINGTEYTKIPQSRIEYLLLQLKALIEGGLGVSDYTELENKPQINSVTLVGNKTLSDLGIINPMMLMGRVDTVADLANVQNPQTGWVYLVGLTTDPAFSEYVYTAQNTWEFMGYNTIVIDSTLSTTSENPVQNKVITGAIDGLVSYDSTNAKLKKTVAGVSTDVMTVDTTPTANSKNPVTSGAVTTALATKADLSIFTPMSESAYEALQTYTNPLYFIYEDAS